VPVEMVQFLSARLLKQNSCCAPRFPLIASCYKICYLQREEPRITWRTLSLKQQCALLGDYTQPLYASLLNQHCPDGSEW